MPNWMLRKQQENWQPPVGIVLPENTINMERDGNQAQKLAYKIVKNYWQSQDKTDSLRLILHGTAGTGKTWVIKALKQLMKDDIHMTAMTGKAATLIDGQTIHSLLTMPCFGRNHPAPRVLVKESLRNHQERWAAHKQHPERCFIVLDEMSLCGQESLFWLDSRARQATGHNKPFGGLSIILAGDFGQLPPVEDHAMFEDPGKYDRRVRGFGLYSLFNDVVLLTENIRSKNQAWRDLLLRIRDGCTTRADYQLLSTRFKTDENYAEFEDALST